MDASLIADVNIDYPGSGLRADDDTFTVAEDADATNFDVLDNDRSSTGDDNDLTITGIGTTNQFGDLEIATDNKSLIYSPDSNFNGTETFSYTVADGSGDVRQATVDVTVTPVNDPPVAHNDVYSITPDRIRPAVLDVTDNDTTAPDEGEELTITDVSFVESTTSTATVDDDGKNILYSPLDSFAGTETLIYTVSDGNGLTDQATVEVSTNVLLSGAPLLIPLDGSGVTGDPTFDVSSDNGLVQPELLTGNRFLRIRIRGIGEMVFMLLESQAPRATSQIIELAESGDYTGVPFHRVIDGFVIQAGDITDGDGTGGSRLDDFDDQFTLMLQHIRRGLLSMAKGGDDTNDSQFFIIDVATRSLDFNHTIFGILVDGDDVREAISNIAVSGSSPTTPVIIDSMEVFTSTQYAVVKLIAAEGTNGNANITVSIQGDSGGSTSVFPLVVIPDPFNGGPFLADVAPLQTGVGQSLNVQLSAIDAEEDTPRFTALRRGTVQYDFDINEETGLLTITPPAGFVGTMEILVRVNQTTSSDTEDFFDSQLLTIEVV